MLSSSAFISSGESSAIAFNLLMLSSMLSSSLEFSVSDNLSQYLFQYLQKRSVSVCVLLPFSCAVLMLSSSTCICPIVLFVNQSDKTEPARIDIINTTLMIIRFILSSPFLRRSASAVKHYLSYTFFLYRLPTVNGNRATLRCCLTSESILRRANR